MIGEMLAERYVVKRRLASGRYLSTYEAEDAELGTLVSVDVLEAEGLPAGLAAERVEEILEAAVSVRGAHIAVLYAWGRIGEGGPFFMVGENVEGAPLLDVLDDCGELPPSQVVEIARAAVEALAESYGRGLFYLGLNPGQVVVCDGGAVKLVRVGYGWILEESEPRLAQRVSLYRAPETDGGVEGLRTSDVYALAAMIRGILPREAVSERLRSLLDTATDPLPRNRPSSPRLLLEELEASVLRGLQGSGSKEEGGTGETPAPGGLSFLKEGMVARPLVPGEERKRSSVLRNLFLVVLGGVALWVCFAAAAGMLSGRGERENAAPVEEEEKVTLPDLQGMALEEARGLLDSLGLEYECRSAPSRLWSAGRVAAQEPAEGSLLTRGEKVVLVVSAGREGNQTGGSEADGTAGPSSSGMEEGSPGAPPPGGDPTASRSGPSVEQAPTSTPQGMRMPDAPERAPSPPHAVLAVSPRSGAAPLCVSMDAGRSFDPDGDIVRYVWRCGDGTVLEGMTAQHVFDPPVIPARFQVVLEVFDSRGSSSTASVTLEVY
ncbi:MAG: PASTA domain-containing protein [Actinobacteria bacterium]|nr:PASTA domain-containing protein [Actinomycetota bacterium]